ncbi:hypothetical protein ACFC34_38225 [Streptomyces sp. NPDC056053]|uniref:hypothetical protein n=1 Tax=Streptomyces sp. NPDC056053 TaxID=3345696 RepID=UPI0035E25591
MTDPMAPDDILRACGYLEAVWREDETDTAALGRHEPGERPTAVLLTELGESIMQFLLPGQAGIHDGMGDQELAAAAEKMRTDPTVRVSRVLLETLQALAPTATAAQTEIIARALISYLLAVSTATENDVLPLLGHLRQAALQRGSDPSV